MDGASRYDCSTAFIVITMTSWRSSVAAILGEDVLFTRPSLQSLDRIQRMSLYTTEGTRGEKR